MVGLFISNLFAVASIVFIVVCIVVLLGVSRYRRIRVLSKQLESEREMEQDAIRRAASKLKYMNSNRKQREDNVIDPLKELFGVEAPTTLGPVMRNPRSGNAGHKDGVS